MFQKNQAEAGCCRGCCGGIGLGSFAWVKLAGALRKWQLTLIGPYYRPGTTLSGLCEIISHHSHNPSMGCIMLLTIFVPGEAEVGKQFAGGQRAGKGRSLDSSPGGWFLIHS